MQESTASRPAPITAIVVIVGGALLAVGSFLAWAEVSGSGTNVTAAGTDGSDGWITFVAGVVVLAVGLTLFRAGKRALAVLAIVAALIGGGVGLYDALTAKDRVLDSAAEELVGQFGGSVAEVRALLDAAIDAGELGISLAFGLYMVIAGGALGVVGGALALRAASAAPAMPTVTGMAAGAPPPVPAAPAAEPPASAWGSPSPMAEPPASAWEPPAPMAEPPASASDSPTAPAAAPPADPEASDPSGADDAGT